MKKIIVLSDTHGNQKYLRQAFNNEKGIDIIFHLGDNYNDLDHNIDLLKDKEFFHVPGIFHPGYLSGKIKPGLSVAIDNWNFYLIHNIDDYHPQKHRSDIVFFGHTHNPEILKYEKTYFINPGHLKQAFHRNSEPSYIVIEVSEDKLVFIFKKLHGQGFKFKTISRNDLEV